MATLPFLGELLLGQFVVSERSPLSHQGNEISQRQLFGLFGQPSGLTVGDRGLVGEPGSR